MHDYTGYRDHRPGFKDIIELGEPALFITGAAQLEIGHSLSDVAAHLLREVHQLRALDEFPAQASLRIAVDFDTDQLDITVEGLSPEADPDRISTRTALHTIFEIAGHVNLIDVTGTRPPRFTLRILAVDESGKPYAGLIGTGMGDIHPVDPPRAKRVRSSVPKAQDR